MKRITSLAVVLLLLASIGLAEDNKAKSGAGTSAVEQNLMDMENQWAKAAKASDPDAINAFLADDFVNVDSDGSMRNKSESLARIKGSKWETNDISDMKVTPHGNSAVVTGTWTGKGSDGAGKSWDSKERFVDTWVKMPNGKWQCVASASAPMGK